LSCFGKTNGVCSHKNIGEYKTSEPKTREAATMQDTTRQKDKTGQDKKKTRHSDKAKTQKIQNENKHYHGGQAKYLSRRSGVSIVRRCTATQAKAKPRTTGESNSTLEANDLISLYNHVAEKCMFYKIRQDKEDRDKKRKVTRQNKTRQDKTRQDKTRQDKTRHNKTTQHKTRQHKTRQDKTKTRQNEIMQD
jgi:hypothetical protein